MLGKELFWQIDMLTAKYKFRHGDTKIVMRAAFLENLHVIFEKIVRKIMGQSEL